MSEVNESHSKAKNSTRKRKSTSEPNKTPVKVKKSKMGKLLSKNSPPDEKHVRREDTDPPRISKQYSQREFRESLPVISTIQRPIKSPVGTAALWDEADVLASQCAVHRGVAHSFVKLVKEGNTLPFIARYRKEMVGHLTPDILQKLFEHLLSITELKKKAKNAIESLKKSNKLTEDVERSIVNAKSFSELELVYAPLKTQTVSLAQKARNLGLEPPALQLLNRGESIDIQRLCNPRVEELATPDKVETHIIHIMADIIYKDPRVLEKIMKLKEEARFYLESNRTKSSLKSKDVNEKVQSRSDPDTYKLYFEFRRACKDIQPHQTLAINRGEDEKILSVKVSVPDWFLHQLERFCKTIWRSVILNKALTDGFNRLIKPWLSRQVRSELTKIAQKEAIQTFSVNLEKYLLTEPIKNRTIAGLDPGFRAGCKVGIIDCHGKDLYVCTLRPNLHSDAMYDRAAGELRSILEKYNVELIGLGNGTACRETESWLNRHNISTIIPVVIVPEQGASIYSISKEAIKEHPMMDPNHISALSIARRVLDPLGELIKVEPKNLGVGLYQHDIPEKMLDSALSTTLEIVVSSVGADLNTASHALLKRIAGLKENQVKNIIAYREKNGRFSSRAELMKVTGVGKVTYEQCAGFLTVLGGSEPLDSTIIHPESYHIAKKLAQKLDLNLSNICDPYFANLARTKLSSVDLDQMAKYLGTDESTLTIIVTAFKRSSHEATIEFQKPIYSVCVQGVEQLKAGMIITGVVRNVVAFGCFVDCGVKDNGLIHTKNMGGNQTPKLGDRVSVTVMSTPKPKKIELKLNRILND